VAIDFDSASRDSKSQSKELYNWGQTEGEDIKDGAHPLSSDPDTKFLSLLFLVTDRLAYLNFVQGSLAGTLATKLDAARAPLKALRDAENALTPRRNIRAGYQFQISKLEHEQERGSEQRIAQFKQQLKNAELNDEQSEKELELLKRKAIRESEQARWTAFREVSSLRFSFFLLLIFHSLVRNLFLCPKQPPPS
jgi:Eisosome component PIL1